MNEIDGEKSPHYISELDPENEASPRDTGALIYGIMTLLPFTVFGTIFGIRNDNSYLLFLGLASSAITVLSLVLILWIKRKRDF